MRGIEPNSVSRSCAALSDTPSTEESSATLGSILRDGFLTCYGGAAVLSPRIRRLWCIADNHSAISSMLDNSMY